MNEQALLKSSLAPTGLADGIRRTGSPTVTDASDELRSGGRNIPSRIRRLFYGSRCVVCFRPDDIRIDHIIPYSAGGDTSLINLQPLCCCCNHTKNFTKTTDQLRAYFEINPLEFVRKQNWRSRKLFYSGSRQWIEIHHASFFIFWETPWPIRFDSQPQQ